MAQGFTKGVPIDTDVNLTSNSNLLVPSQHAVVEYVYRQIALKGGLNTNKNVLVDGGTFLAIGENVLIDGGSFL